MPVHKPVATGKGLKSAGRVVSAVARHTPLGIGIDVLGALHGGGEATKKKRRSRGMHMRKGRLFIGFSQHDVKAAMHRTYGGGRRRRGK